MEPTTMKPDTLATLNANLANADAWLTKATLACVETENTPAHRAALEEQGKAYLAWSDARSAIYRYSVRQINASR